MVAAPEAMASTTPPAGVTVATDGVLELHVPPPGASVAICVDPVHIWLAAVIDARKFTVTVLAAKQPGATTYDIVAVPTEMPDTAPVGYVPAADATVATTGFPLLHKPPETESLRKILFPWQSVESPMIAVGNG